MNIVGNIKKINEETTLYSFEGHCIPTMIELLGMSLNGCTHSYIL